MHLLITAEPLHPIFPPHSFSSRLLTRWIVFIYTWASCSHSLPFVWKVPQTGLWPTENDKQLICDSHTVIDPCMVEMHSFSDHKMRETVMASWMSAKLPNRYIYNQINFPRLQIQIWPAVCALYGEGSSWVCRWEWLSVLQMWRVRMIQSDVVLPPKCGLYYPGFLPPA